MFVFERNLMLLIPMYSHPFILQIWTMLWRRVCKNISESPLSSNLQYGFATFKFWIFKRVSYPPFGVLWIFLRTLPRTPFIYYNLLSILLQTYLVDRFFRRQATIIDKYTRLRPVAIIKGFDLRSVSINCSAGSKSASLPDWPRKYVLPQLRLILLLLFRMYLIETFLHKLLHWKQYDLQMPHLF